ncbi:hypothetical protein AC579_9183 [Pseudocercospora musae]|uniref:TM7S3/TM198-like domain-containing protein n=1 Tax=Pseudocercospora musae TaxID=113226 RepID=A0A139H1H3_9PEZI|nr:hypothetical protein AC579_9183 [Pseudocercospora musae]
MRLQYTFVSLLVALSCAEQLERNGLRARQDDVATATHTAPASSKTNVESTPTTTGPASTASASKTGDEGKTKSNDISSGDATSPITLAPTATPNIDTPHSNATLPADDTNDTGALPIKPRITPGLGVAGAILIIAGLVLGFVGIKHRPTQTFLSTSLLIALGIEVLVIYLMNPPVPDAIQGAYVVAGVVGGCLLGSLALIFKEVSEGFGCVLGGFCFAMWLLTLAPGGLIKNQVGRIILIGIFCAACFCLYISRYTRVYGIIGCTSFAGSVAFVLGIDCFSKAGLKEFWMYIWNLNADVFPLFTDTYPINRNMRAELAAIIIVAFLGTLSQIKIWKIVKEQKARREADRLREQELRDAEEAEVGRDIESRVAIDRAAWEGDYDGKKAPMVHIDSAMASTDNITRKNSGADSYNTSKKDGEKRFSFAMVNIRPGTRDSMGKRSSTSKRKSNASFDFLASSYKRSSAVPSLPPLTFGEGDTNSPVARSTSAAESPSTTAGPSTPGLGISGAGALNDRRGVEMNRSSLASLSAKAAQDAAQQDDWEPEEDDLASSVAATMAEGPDMDAFSTKALSRPGSSYFPYGAGSSPLNSQEEFIEDNDDEALCLPQKSPSVGGGSSRLSVGPRTPGTLSRSPSIRGDSNATSREPVVLKDKLPKRISKAAQNYRTGEWAKEVTRAEPEPLEEVPEHTLDAVQVEMDDAAEKARARENNASPLPPPVPPVPEQVAAPSKAEKKISQRLSRTPSGSAAVPIYAHASTAGDADWSAPLAKRTSSNPALTSAPMTDGTRNVSAPLLDEQPPKDYFPPMPKPDRTSLVPNRLSLMPGRATPNLLDERRERLSNRITTTSFMTPTPEVVIETASTSDVSKGGGSTGEKSSVTSLSDGNVIGEEGAEDMTLAERKALVQQQAILSHQNARMSAQDLRNSMMTTPLVNAIPGSSTFPAPKPVRLSSAGTQQPIYDSHQPRRTSHNANKQAMNWSAWRSSNAIVADSRLSYNNADSQMDMLRAARVQSEVEAKAREQRKKELQEQIDAHMRMGGMHDRHREVLSRMQNKVDKNI